MATGPFSQFPRVGEITPTEIGNVREELVTDADVATWYERTGARPRRAPRATITAWWFGCRCGWFRRVTLHQLQQAHDQPVTDVERWQTITL